MTTRGFRDVPELRRSARGNLYDLFQDAPATLIPRWRPLRDHGTRGADGGIVVPLVEDEVEGLIAALGNARARSVAVCLLFSFLNPEHERRVGSAACACLVPPGRGPASGAEEGRDRSGPRLLSSVGAKVSQVHPSGGQAIANLLAGRIR